MSFNSIDSQICLHENILSIIVRGSVIIGVTTTIFLQVFYCFYEICYLDSLSAIDFAITLRVSLILRISFDIWKNLTMKIIPIIIDSQYKIPRMNSEGSILNNIAINFCLIFFLLIHYYFRLANRLLRLFSSCIITSRGLLP